MEIENTGHTGKVSVGGVSVRVDVIKVDGKHVLHKQGDSLDKECFYVIVDDKDVLESIIRILNMVEGP